MDLALCKIIIIILYLFVIQVMAKCGGSQEQITRVLRIKQNLDHATRKVTQLKIRRKTRHSILGTSQTRKHDFVFGLFPIWDSAHQVLIVQVLRFFFYLHFFVSFCITH